MMRCRLVLAMVVLCWAPRAEAGELSVKAFEYIARRSPSVFDVFFRSQKIAENRLPRVYFDFDLVIGPAYDILTNNGPIQAQIAGGRLSGGSVIWSWGENKGLRVGIDGYSTNLTPKGSPMEDGWGFRSALSYIGAFDRDAGWSATAGVYITAVPAMEVIGGELVFSVDPSADGAGTTVTDYVAGFVHGTIPWADITAGLIFDDEGVRKLKGTANVSKIDLWESLGPMLGAFPQHDHYQFGAHATRFRAWEAPITLSMELAGRYESGEGVAFNHMLFSADLTLFEDKPKREKNFRKKEFETDFHIRAQLHASYFNMPGAEVDWGVGGLVEFLSIRLLGGEWRFTLGGSYNYYDDIVMLAVPEVFMVKLALAAAW